MNAMTQTYFLFQSFVERIVFFEKLDMKLLKTRSKRLTDFKENIMDGAFFLKLYFTEDAEETIYILYHLFFF